MNNNVNSSIFFDNVLNNTNNLTDYNDWTIVNSNFASNFKPIHKWVNDDAVTSCYNCACEFSFIKRKHHCRLCGRIFCNNCSDFWQKIPKISNVPTKIFSIKNIYNNYFYREKERLCINCNLQIHNQETINKLLLMFKFLDIADIKKLSVVSKIWNKACLQYLAMFRGIQYKFVDHKLSETEFDMLQNNKNYLVNHSKWEYILIRYNCRFPDKTSNTVSCNGKTTLCANVLCNYPCRKRIYYSDLIVLLTLQKNIQYDKVLELVNMCDIEFLCYVPLFIDICEYKNNFIIDVLILKIKQCVEKITNSKDCEDNDVIMMLDIIWSLCRIGIIYTSKFCRNKYMLIKDDNNNNVSEMSKTSSLSKNEKHESLEQQIMFFDNVVIQNAIHNFAELQLLKHIDKKNYAENINTIFDKLQKCFLFGYAEFVSVDINNVICIHSKTKPLLIPLIMKRNKKTIVKKYLLKNEGVYKDYIVCKIIKMIIFFLKRDNIIYDEYINYNVHLIDFDCGFVEIIDGAETLFSIKNKLNTTILNYILDNNKHKTIDDVRQIFINSLSLYSIITYLLGIGDRHLNNIMVHKSGSIFHIDFGFIMGSDPKLKTSNIRLTHDMIDAIGGIYSNGYTLFKQKCSIIFNHLRKYMNIIFSMLKLCFCHENLDSSIVDEFISRFEPGEKYIDAENHIINIVDNSLDSVATSFFDTLHKFCVRM